MCTRHALIRAWQEKSWWLICCNPGCAYRIFESHPSYPTEAPMTRTVEIKLHPELRAAMADPTPKTDEDKVVWPLLDTAYQLVREAAVRAVFVEIRKQAAEQGVTLGTDEELIQQSLDSGVEGAPKTVMDLAPDHPMVADAFHSAFEGLFALAMQDAVQGLNEVREEDTVTGLLKDLGLDG